MNKKTQLQQRWAKSVNDPANMPEKDEYGTKYKKIDGIHHIVYNALRGKPLNRGFKENKYFDYLLYNFDIKVKYSRWDYLFRYTGQADGYEEKLNEALRLYSCS